MRGAGGSRDPDTPLWRVLVRGVVMLGLPVGIVLAGLKGMMWAYDVVVSVFFVQVTRAEVVHHTRLVYAGPYPGVVEPAMWVGLYALPVAAVIGILLIMATVGPRGLA